MRRAPSNGASALGNLPAVRTAAAGGGLNGEVLLTIANERTGTRRHEAPPLLRPDHSFSCKPSTSRDGATPAVTAALLLAIVHVIALFGPTGVGKTAVAVALAELLRDRGEDPLAVSADALQVYRGLELLTGAAGAAEQDRLEHRLVSFVGPDKTYSAGQFAARAREEIDAALAAGRRPLVVGGTGLYLQAALTDLELRPPPDPRVRERLEARVAERGAPALHAELVARSPSAAAGIDPRDRTRVIRALELLEMGEKPPPAGAESRLWTARLRHPTLLCGLVMERAALYERIDLRVDEMVAAGACEQVRAAHAAGASRTARSALGFEELLRGDIEATKQRTRNYAKRQLAWMRRLADVQRIDLTNLGPEAAAQRIAHILAERPGEAPNRGESL